MCRIHRLTHLRKKTHTKLNTKCPEHSMWAFPSFQLHDISVIENFGGFGSYLFIYSKPSCLSLSTQEPMTLVWHSSCDPTLEGGMIKGSLARLGKTFPPRMDILPVKRLFPPRWGSRSRYSRVRTWKGKIWLESPTYMFFFPTRANGRHQPEQNILLITCWGGGVGVGGTESVPFPNQYSP